MIYEVTTQSREINFAPSSILEEVFQNVYTLLTTIVYTVPLNRGIGINASPIDEPTLISKARLVAEIIEKVQMYEERVIVEEVLFNENQEEGRVDPIVRIRLREGVMQ